MKYAYIVTRIIKNNLEGVTNIPNLGVHTSYARALKHYRGVVSDRLRLPYTDDLRVNQKQPMGEERCIVLDDLYVGDGETVRLEKWKVS